MMLIGCGGGFAVSAKPTCRVMTHGCAVTCTDSTYSTRAPERCSQRQSNRSNTTIWTHHRPPALAGPGAYPEPAPDRGVAYSFPGPARPGPEPGADSPGPSHYRPASPPSGPAYTFRPKPPDPKPPSVPGPGEYSSPGKSEAPAYTIRPRPKDPEPPRSPGPGEYHKPDPGNGPAYTMPGR